MEVAELVFEACVIVSLVCLAISIYYQQRINRIILGRLQNNKKQKE